jgi:hypothetical protein
MARTTSNPNVWDRIVHGVARVTRKSPEPRGVRHWAPGDTGWHLIDAAAARTLVREVWPTQAHGLALLVGDALNDAERQATSRLCDQYSIEAVDRADGVCHSPARAVLDAALGTARVTPSAMVRADHIVVLGDPIANNASARTALLAAHGVGVPVTHVGVPSILVGERLIGLSPARIPAFLHAVIKHMLFAGTLDREFIREHTSGFEAVLAALETEPTEELLAIARCSSVNVRTFADAWVAAQRPVVLWSPSGSGLDAHIAASLASLLLVSNAVGSDERGLCVVGPLAEVHPEHCCTTRNTNPHLPVVSILERAQHGDFNVLITVGDQPFGQASADEVVDAFDAVRLHLHLGTVGSQAPFAHQTPTLVVPGPLDEAIEWLARTVIPVADALTVPVARVLRQASSATDGVDDAGDTNRYRFFPLPALAPTDDRNEASTTR